MAAGADDWGGSPEPDWKPHLVDLPCRVWFQSGREVTSPDKTAVIEDRKAILPVDADVTEGDRLRSVTDRRGREIQPGPMRIESVGRKDDHLLLALEAV